MKVFSLLSLIRNLTVSIKDEDNDNTHFLYWYGLCAMPIMGVGSCNRLFVLGFVKTSYQINETTNTWGMYGRTEGATDSDNGYINAQTIKNNRGSLGYAFKWCENYEIGWYLPTINEWRSIFNARLDINKTLSSNGYKTLNSYSTYTSYWTSKEYSAYEAHIFQFSEQGHILRLDKNYERQVRAVASIEI